jgi:hypothetical protein
MARKKKVVVGLVEKVKITGLKGTVETKALIDTGATRSSIDIRLAAKAGLGPIIKAVKVKSKTAPFDYMRRAVVPAEVELRGVKKKAEFTIADRTNMSYPVLIGRNILHGDFTVDIDRTHKGFRVSDFR